VLYLQILALTADLSGAFTTSCANSKHIANSYCMLTPAECYHCPQGYQQMLPAAAAVSAAAALPTKAISAKTNGLFDPLGPLDVDALNAAYIQKHQAALLGSHLRL
jgi:hypothetical protein